LEFKNVPLSEEKEDGKLPPPWRGQCRKRKKYVRSKGHMKNE